LQRLTDGEADEPHERCRIHAKANFFGVPGIDQQCDAAASLRYGFIHLLRLAISSASLNIAMKKMVGYSVEHSSGRLCACRIIKKNKPIP
jgi:hypothetical protein